MSVKKPTTLRQRGDTIIEVLIAIAVSSVVLVSAFVVVNRTTKNVRQSQEHTEALKLVEGQVEMLKAYVNTPGKPLPIIDICFDKAAPTVPVPSPATDLKCRPNNGGAYRYDLKIVKSGGLVPLSGAQYVVSADWESAVSGRDHVEIVYRVYQ